LQTERPDAAVIDINVNGENTAAVAQHLAANNVPYVVVTGYGPSELEAEVWRQAPLLQKPVRTAELVRVVSELLHPTPAERRASG
jgi:response regulator RpfG family c-di-GMP phosphodiesterase